jgi:flagellar motor protein MotB
LVALGTPDKRFAAVRGNAERAPLHKKSPEAIENRRIEVTLLRRKPEVAAKDLIPPSLLNSN